MIATAKAYSNIAFIKYWGNQDNELRIPANGSLSMNLEGVETVTTVRFEESLTADRLMLNGSEQTGSTLNRVTIHLDHIRRMAESELKATVVSENNFPAGTGIASSAAGFAALSLAGATAIGMELGEVQLSRLARLGSGSASRSIPTGFVEWYAGTDDENSYAETLVDETHWNLVDLVAVVSEDHKQVGSTGGHSLAPTSPLQDARVADAPRRLDLCRQAILDRDFDAFAGVVEQDVLLMHAVMMTSQPPLIYFAPETLRLIDSVRTWREQEGYQVCFTIDAGPNVHVIVLQDDADIIRDRLESMAGIHQVLRAGVGGPAHLLSKHLPFE